MKPWPDFAEDEALLAKFSAKISSLLAFADGVEAEAALAAAVKAATAEWRYAAGGHTAHRGFYCPSLVYDWVADNADRGRLMIGAAAEAADFRYAFAADGRLLLVENRSFFGAGFGREYLFYEDGQVYGVFYDSDGELTAVSQEIYREGRLESYARTLCYRREEADLYWELCRHQRGRLREATLYLGVAPDLGIYDECRYLFHYDEAGTVRHITEKRVVMGEEIVTEIPARR